MIKEKIIVPAGIRYISDWASVENGYNIANYQYPHMLNKQLTGCGYTEYCLTNQYNVVLCSPRKLLLENKEDQHRGDVLYVGSLLDYGVDSNSYDMDISKPTDLEKFSKAKELEELSRQQAQERLSEMRSTLIDYLHRRADERKPYKILVTYDSFRHVKELLMDLKILDTFFVVIDEFQSIFVDSRFKSTTEIEFVEQLQGIQRVCYVSATPMLDKYLEMLAEFKNLPYFELDWASEDKQRVTRPRLEIKATDSPYKEAGRVIESYKLGRFDVFPYKTETGEVKEIISNEVVLYFNSVKSICQLIKKYKLTQEECNVLCARTEENERQVRKAFGVGKKKFLGLGTIPKRGEPHKMFTFCTRTVYLGADFYSTCAKSFVFSDANVECLAVDISLDLPQIMGRQRLIENPWKNSATIFFKPLSSEKFTKDDFDNFLNYKIRTTNVLLESIDKLEDEEYKNEVIKKYERDVVGSKYKSDYVAVNKHAGSHLVPVFNNLVLVAERRAFDIQQVDYRDRFTVFNTVSETGTDYDIDSDIVTESLAKFDSLNTFVDKMSALCGDSDRFTKEEIEMIMPSIPSIFDKYLRILGPDKIRALKYRKGDLEEEYLRIIHNQDLSDVLREEVNKAFLLNEVYTLPTIKDKLRKIYESLSYKKSPKAIDILDYFDASSIMVTDSGKRSKAYKILSIKS